MQYKGYTITAECQSYDQWSIDDDGELVDWLNGLEGLDVVGYHFDNNETGDHHFESVSECSGEELRNLLDNHIDELAGVTA